jgi:hypothetical protein
MYFRNSYTDGKFKHTYTELFFSIIAHERYNVPLFVQQMDLINIQYIYIQNGSKNRQEMQWVKAEVWSSSSWHSYVHHKHSNPLYCNLTPCCVNIHTEISVTVYFGITYEDRRNLAWFCIPMLKFYFTPQRNFCRRLATHFPSWEVRIWCDKSAACNGWSWQHGMCIRCTSAVPNNKLRCQGYSVWTSPVAISYIQNVRKTGFLCSLKQLYCAVWSYRNTERNKPVVCIIVLGRRTLHGEGRYIIMIWRICGKDFNLQVIGKLLLQRIWSTRCQATAL